MKVGDIVSCTLPIRMRQVIVGPESSEKGVVVEILSASHAKQWQRVRVLTKAGLEEWIMQYCEVVSK